VVMKSGGRRKLTQCNRTQYCVFVVMCRTMLRIGMTLATRTRNQGKHGIIGINRESYRDRIGQAVTSILFEIRHIRWAIAEVKGKTSSTFTAFSPSPHASTSTAGRSPGRESERCDGYHSTTIMIRSLPLPPLVSLGSTLYNGNETAPGSGSLVVISFRFISNLRHLRARETLCRRYGTGFQWIRSKTRLLSIAPLLRCF
jgi:hypothetical protein